MENNAISPIALQVKNLSVLFSGREDFWAVKQLNFTMKRGKTLALVGRSGSGKSVTSLAIMSLLPHQVKVSGEILLEGQKDLLQMDTRQMSAIRGNEIGMVFQEPMSALNPVKTCGYQLTEAILAHRKISRKEAKKIAIDWLGKVKLPQPATLFNRYPHQLSGGQKQRVMIAMAMCNHPKILIADEPTTALDVTVQAGIIALMQELQREYSIALLFITHDLNLAKMIADDFLVMENGEVIHRQPTIFIPDVKPDDDLIDKKDIPLLHAEQLCVTYDGEKKLFQKTPTLFKAVDEVSFYINPGETLGLVGESGCGKSTLSRAILGLQPIRSGKLYFDGKEITGLPTRQWRNLRKEIQIIFQDPYGSLNPRMKVGDAIKEAMSVHQIVPKEALDKETKHLMELVQLPAAAVDKYPHEFSGGQRQRICIARALSLRPRLVICDESVSALDVHIQARILELLADLQKEKQLTYLFITHDLQVVRAISNRVMVMEKGRIVEQGNTEEIMNYPRQAYTQKLLASIPQSSS